MTAETAQPEAAAVLDVIEAFISAEVGFHTPGMREQAADLLTDLADAGLVVVEAPGLTHGDRLEQVQYEDRRYHRFPSDCPDDVEAWKCAACGEWVSERNPTATECSVDWKAPQRRLYVVLRAAAGRLRELGTERDGDMARVTDATASREELLSELRLLRARVVELAAERDGALRADTAERQADAIWNALVREVGSQRAEVLAQSWRRTVEDG